jgi:hypothetical protein
MDRKHPPRLFWIITLRSRIVNPLEIELAFPRTTPEETLSISQILILTSTGDRIAIEIVKEGTGFVRFSEMKLPGGKKIQQTEVYIADGKVDRGEVSSQKTI